MIEYQYLKYFLATISCILLGVVSSQPLSFRHWNVKNGLSSGVNYHILHDSRDFIWTASTYGLNRFDGIHTKVYLPDNEDSTTIKGVSIKRMIEDKKGNLWIGTNEGLNFYDRKKDKFKTFYLLDSTQKRIKTIYNPFYLSEQGDVFVRVRNHSHLFLFDSQTKIFQPIEIQVVNSFLSIPTPKNEKVKKALTFPEKYLYFLQDKNGAQAVFLPKIYENEQLQAQQLFSTKFFPPTNISEFLYEKDSLLWIVGEKGLFLYNLFTKKYAHFHSFDNQEVTHFNCLFSDNKNNLYIGTNENGILVFDKNKRKFIQKIEHDNTNILSLAGNNIEKIYIDKSENMWVSVWGKGIDYSNFAKRKFVHILEEKQSKQLDIQNFIRCILTDKNGNIWVGTHNSGILLLNENKEILQKFVLPNVNVQHLFQDSNRNIWAATTNGIFLYQKQKFIPYYNTLLPEKKADINYVYQITQITDNQLLACTSFGVFSFSFNSATQKIHFEPFTGLTNAAYFYIFQDKKGRLYASFKDISLNIYEKKAEKWEIIQKIDFKGVARACYEDSDFLWIATSLGLWKVNTKTFENELFTQKNGLPSSSIYAILPDKNRYFWLSTQRGICRFSPNSKNCKNYNLSDGLQENEFNTFAYAQTQQGEMLMGGINGINAFFPEQIKDYPYPANVQVTKLKINDLDYTELPDYIGETRQIQLRYWQNTLSFEFSILEYASPEENKCRYKLEGYDKDWLMLDNQGFVRYPQLPSGEYTLKIQAANADDSWNPDIRELKISIPPPFWKTIWFYSLVFLLIAFAIYGYFRYRIKSLEKAQKERLQIILHTQEEERKRIARDMHDDLGASLSTIQLYLSAKSADNEPSAEKKMRENTLTLIKGVIRSVRQILFNLSPKSLEENGYIAAVEELIQRIEQTEVMQFHLDVYNFPERLPAQYEMTLYRLTQELMNNTIKYSRAKNVTLQLFYRENKIIFMYEDDGIGFDKAKNSAGYGLKNIESRVASLNGTLELDTHIGRGVNYLIEIPFFDATK